MVLSLSSLSPALPASLEPTNGLCRWYKSTRAVPVASEKGPWKRASVAGVFVGVAAEPNRVVRRA